MEAAPPSYEKATLTDHWDIVARYVPSNDLCSAALVCSRWHATFAPHLWGNPASHFGVENDRVYVALTRFKRTLRYARLLVRSLTHTLHLPPAHAEIYNGPHADWLRDILQRLPNLQSLIVRGLPFFDHSALQELKYKPPKDHDTQPPPGFMEMPGSAGYTFQNSVSSIPSFGLRLLDASRCSNVTSSGLALALRRFETLLYLDLSFTYPAQDASVLESLRRLSGLQVLKLRGVCLSDAGLETLTQAVGVRVRSLDLRDNRLSDRSVRTLLDHCFITGPEGPSGSRSPSLLPYLGAEMLDIYQGEDFEAYLRKSFTGSFISRLAIEDVPEGGVTHLYIAGNEISAEGASGLVRSGRLHVLDLACVVQEFGRHRSFGRGRRSSSSADVSMPGVEKLTPVLGQYASENLTFLRIDHSLVTRDAPNTHPDEPVQGRVELADTAMPVMSAAAELDGTSAHVEAFELPTVTTPKHELPGDPMQFVISPAINDPPHNVDAEERPAATRRGSAYAPEVVEGLTNETEKIDLLSPISVMGEGTLNGGLSSTSPVSPTTPAPPQGQASKTMLRPRTYSSVATERKARLYAHTNGSHNLHPAMLPHLETLILTDVPSHTADKQATERLILFIKQCAEEARLAGAQARLDYALPPGRGGYMSALKHSAHKIFALKRIVLEMAPEQKRQRSNKALQSMNRDRDIDALWSAAEGDFSFFGEGEQGIYPSLDYGRFADATSDQKEVSLTNVHHPAPSPLPPQPPIETRVDTVSTISAFRKDRKLANQRSLAAGATESPEGYWDGVIQVVRPSGELRADEEIDYYGNRFVGGWLYR